jgi:hypothetical protein
LWSSIGDGNGGVRLLSRNSFERDLAAAMEQRDTAALLKTKGSEVGRFVIAGFRDVTPGEIEAVTVAEVIDDKLLPAAAGRRRSSTTPMSRSVSLGHTRMLRSPDFMQHSKQHLIRSPRQRARGSIAGW